MKWISVKNRLPEPHEVCITYGKKYGMNLTNEHDGNHWVNSSLEEIVTHWMPLPISPRKNK